jgi:branched-chain amino acid transport system ATP-binding protein
MSDGQVPILEARDLYVRYGAAQALFGVSFVVPAGTVLAILGPNGAGKSTIARSLTGLVRPHSGSILLSGIDVTAWPAHRIRKAGVVHLPEGRGVFPGLTVAENLRMASLMLPRRDRADAVDRGVDFFPALADRRRQLAGTLSGGEQQMLSLARALIVGPRVIVADELSLGLAPRLVDEVFEGLRKAKATGAAVVQIEQYVHRSLEFADTCLLVQRGQVAWAGSARAAREQVLTSYLGGSSQV